MLLHGLKQMHGQPIQLPRSGVAFEDIVQFVDQNPDWPALDTISRRAEEALLDRPTNDTLVLATDVRTLTQSQVQGLLAWVRKGGQMIFPLPQISIIDAGNLDAVLAGLTPPR